MTPGEQVLVWLSAFYASGGLSSLYICRTRPNACNADNGDGGMWLIYTAAGFITVLCALCCWVADRRNDLSPAIQENLIVWRAIKNADGEEAKAQRAVLRQTITDLRKYPGQQRREARRRLGDALAADVRPAVQTATVTANEQLGAYRRVDTEVTDQINNQT